MAAADRPAGSHQACVISVPAEGGPLSAR